MNDAEKEFNLIMTSDMTGVIACMIAEQTGQTPYRALRSFIRSTTYSLFRDTKTFENNWGPGPIAAAYLQEIGYSPN